MAGKDLRQLAKKIFEDAGVRTYLEINPQIREAQSNREIRQLLQEGLEAMPWERQEEYRKKYDR